MGQIMLFESNGDYKQVQISDPRKPSFPIFSVLPFTMGSQGDNSNNAGKSQLKSGFIVAGDSGTLRVYVKSD